ncbi:hypothetical protein [Legionella fallonii]|nr:hypothetical protein [Legionella fallonii]
MIYLVQGNVQELFHAFDLEWMITAYPGAQSIGRDLPKTRFLGSADQSQYFVDTWETKAEESYYLSGNMTAGNLFWILNHAQPLRKDGESLHDYEENFVHQHFAFVNEEQELCGCMLMYRQDEPTQWVIALVKNTHLAPEKRDVTILSGFNLNPYIKAAGLNITVSTTESLDASLMKPIHSPGIEHVLQQVIKASCGEINIRAMRLVHLLRLIQVYVIHDSLPNIIELESGEINALRTKLTHLGQLAGVSDQVNELPIDLFNPSDIQPQLLFADNPALDLLAEYKLSLSAAMLKDCLSKNSGLRKEIEQLVLSDDEQVNRNLLQMIILFYEENILNEHKELLQKHVFIKTRGGFLWNNAQIQLIPFLLKNKYSLNLFTLILSEESYYHAILTLIQLGYTHDIPRFLAITDKCSELEYIHRLDNEDTKKLCLIFWAKGHFSHKIVRATETYPMLAKTLVSLDQTEVTHIKNLRELALTPLEHQKLSIMHHYAEQFGKAAIKDNLKLLDAEELAELIKSLDVLKKSGVDLSDSYIMLTKSNKQGALLRLFLPDFNKVENDFHRQELIRLLYLGIKNGPVTQGKAIQGITDRTLQHLAKNLHERFICAKQMQDLGFNKGVIALAAEEKGIKGSRFRRIILRVEEECKKVQESLRESRANNDQITQWQKKDKDYRRTLYSIAYDGLTKAAVDINARINEIEMQVLSIVDPKIESWLYKALITIANIAIFILTCGIGNDIKEKRTGNYWFFNQTGLGEQLKSLDKEVIHVIESPEPASILSF